jgi:hypothetical protein
MKSPLLVVAQAVRKKRFGCFVMQFIVFGLNFVASASAAIINWTGSGTVQTPMAGVFSDPGNWEGDTLPAFDSTTDLAFNLSAQNYVATNDLGTLTLNSLIIRANGNTGGGSVENSQLLGGTLRFVADGTTGPSLTLTGMGQHAYIGSNLVLDADLDVIRTSQAAGTIFGIGFGITSGGNIDLGSHTLRVTRPSSTPGDVNRVFIGGTGSTARGVVQGTGRIVLEDPSYTPTFSDQGPQTIHLASRNTYSGGTEVRQGQLAIAGETFFSNGVIESGPFGTGPVRMYQGVLRSGPTKRTLYNTVEVNGSFDLGFSGFQGISVAGTIQLNGTFTIGVAADTTGTVEVSGPITESSPGFGLTWDLDSDLVLTSVATYTGPTVVRGAGLHLNSPGSLGASPLRLTAGAKLFGDGQTGPLVAEGSTTVSPGEGIGVLRTVGNAGLESGSRLSLDITSTQAGLGYDQWALEGALTLTDVDLQLIFAAFQIQGGNTFYLITNDGNDPVNGVFTRLNGISRNLSEGAAFAMMVGPVSGTFEISYTAEEGVGFAGVGNDIAIRAVPEPSTSLALLSGFAALVVRRGRGRTRPTASGGK